MGQIRRTRASLRNYQIIWDYIAERDLVAADSLLRSFDEKLTLLAAFPGARQARPELRPRLRSFPVKDYLIFYRPIRGGIELIRVLHGARSSPRFSGPVTHNAVELRSPRLMPRFHQLLEPRLPVQPVETCPDLKLRRCPADDVGDRGAARCLEVKLVVAVDVAA